MAPPIGYIPWNKGVKNCFSDEVLRRMSITRTGKSRNPHTEETKLKMSIASKGKKKSPEHCISMSIAKTGVPNYKTRGVVREDMVGENNHNWKGGIAKIDKMCRSMSEYKLWRSRVLSRDNFQCVKCEHIGYITAHHIISFSKIIKDNNVKTREDARSVELLWDITNGITLCEDCHSKTDNYKGRGTKK